MKNFSFTLIFLITLGLKAQVNETANNRYEWGRKGTEPAPGYVVLKSGKRMDGTLELKGEPNSIKKIILIKDGKEIELEPASLTAFGLTAGDLVNDSPEELYEWKSPSTSVVMNKEVTKQSTKSRRGYLILNDGTRMDGMLHLNKLNGALDELVIKNDKDGKQVLSPSKVSHYGIVPTIEDLNKGGTIIHNDMGKNFNPGFAIKSDDSKIEGYMAFMRASDIPRTDAVIYYNLYYAAQETDVLMIISSDKLKEVTHKINGAEIVYVKFKDGFVEKSKMSSLSEADQYKLFQEGKIVLTDKTELLGQVAQVFDDGKSYSKAVKFKDAAGQVKMYPAAEVNRFEQKIDKVSKLFFPFEGEFVMLVYDGSTFCYFKNPHPKSINKLATNAAKFGASAAASAGSRALVNSTGASEESRKEINKNISNASSEDLKKTIDEGDKIKSASKNEDLNSDITKLQGAAALEAAGREMAKSIVIYNTEFCIYNKNSKDNTIVIKNDYGDSVEPLLKSCESYLMMDKAAQKKCREIEQLNSTLKMLDECYQSTK